MVTNNVTRLLVAKKIPFEAYELPAEKLGGLETARLLGVDAALVFKTIVVTREKSGKPILAVIPATSQVNLKALAACLGEKKLKTPTQREAETLTGLQAGGISPLALIHKGFRVIIDQAALQHEQIHVSGGRLGLNIRLPVNALIELTGASAAAISMESNEASEQA
ncbi:MAG: YbaK/EbsC family protein [Chloroflexota bacterium]|jgi:Cys-tRNA(Pro)/Cys-tRNA(Cys) deacylase